MKEQPRPFFRPYLLMLKEGEGIQEDFMDYKLVMLHLDSAERIGSPKDPKGKLNKPPMAQMPPHPIPPVLTANDPIL